LTLLLLSRLLPPIVAMASKLPRPHLRSRADLMVLRWVLGWQTMRWLVHVMDCHE
jgi:hypothetical protein